MSVGKDSDCPDTRLLPPAVSGGSFSRTRTEAAGSASWASSAATVPARPLPRTTTSAITSQVNGVVWFSVIRGSGLVLDQPVAGAVRVVERLRAVLVDDLPAALGVAAQHPGHPHPQVPGLTGPL